MSTAAVILNGVSHAYGKQIALDSVSLSIPAQTTIGLIGPDGVGKSTLLSLIAGVKIIQQGQVLVFGQDMADKSVRTELSHKVAFMPQGLGHNLYPTLTVKENIDFHARLFGLNRQQRQQQITRLLQATMLMPFADREAGKLSGGMKQKLSLCCALVHNPDLLILDEPTTGVDPLSRRQFWSLVDQLRQENPSMTVIVATAYIDEAERFDYLLAMDAGHILAVAPTQQVIQHSHSKSLEEAYIKLLPPDKRSSYEGLEKTEFVAEANTPYAIEAQDLTKRFAEFTAVNKVSFKIHRGEIFGFLGSNGCGKSTTMKMLTGLLDATSGTAKLLGHEIDVGDMSTRMRVGYMSQAFSLYEELTVRQNLVLHARLYRMQGAQAEQAVAQALHDYDLLNVAEQKPVSLSLGIRQRLQLATACLHHPEVLILDEPTSGVDPAARDMFWRQLLTLSRRDKITIFVSTHFMNEAERCDRISFMHQGQVLAVGTPKSIQERKQVDTLEQAFIRYLEEAEADLIESPKTAKSVKSASTNLRQETKRTDGLAYGFGMTWTFAVRETKEILRDKIRLFFAIFGPILLMMGASVGVSFDISDIRFAVMDQDQSIESRELIQSFAGSRYFSEQATVITHQETDHALRSSAARLVIVIPPNFGRDLLGGVKPEVNFIIDGSVPFLASNIEGFSQGIMTSYTLNKLQHSTYPGNLQVAYEIEPRFVYNQDFKSVNAITPSTIMLALMMIPAMMTALGVVREREIGSITNLYTSPASVTQFLIGKQLPYVGLALLSFFVMVWLAIVALGVPLKGNFLALILGSALMVGCSTAFGLLISCFVRSQVAAIFATAILSMIPALSYSGMVFPVSSLTGVSSLIAWGFPTSWYQLISVGVFTKGLGLSSFGLNFLVLAIFILLYVGIASLFLKKQEA